MLLIGIFAVTLCGTYMDCLLRHRNDDFFLTPREPIHEACLRNLNPFHL
jgi:hypothetical protein